MVVASSIQCLTVILPQFKVLKQSNKLTIDDLPNGEGPFGFILILNTKPIPPDGFLSQS